MARALVQVGLAGAPGAVMVIVCARLRGLVAQLAAGERQEHALEARRLDDEFSDTAAVTRQERLRERVAARLEDDVRVLADRAIGIGGHDVGRGRLLGRNYPKELLAMRELPRGRGLGLE